MLLLKSDETDCTANRDTGVFNEFWMGSDRSPERRIQTLSRSSASLMDAHSPQAQHMVLSVTSNQWWFTSSALAGAFNTWGDENIFQVNALTLLSFSMRQNVYSLHFQLPLKLKYRFRVYDNSQTLKHNSQTLENHTDINLEIKQISFVSVNNKGRFLIQNITFNLSQSHHPQKIS